MTLLDAINIVARSVGEGPFSDLTSPHPTVQDAKSIIEQLHEATLASGWWFNRSRAVQLLPDSEGIVYLPSDTISATPVGRSMHLVQRANFLFNPITNTRYINTAATVDLITNIDFDDCPIQYQMAVAYQAAYKFVSDEDGDSTKARRLLDDSAAAGLTLAQENLRQMRYNALNSPQVAFLMRGRRKY